MHEALHFIQERNELLVCNIFSTLFVAVFFFMGPRKLIGVSSPGKTKSDYDVFSVCSRIVTGVCGRLIT